ncbi:MAG: GNAT family N-acetyltransferase [Oscillospiraceae bacterium]|nr:GNAT family N-acetyltransferase [Oscillospiraceae bacterium]
MVEIKAIRTNPQLDKAAADFFASRWNLDPKLFLDDIARCVLATDGLPSWYVLVKNGNIIGGCGLVENDFMVDDDKGPWLVALFIDPKERGHRYGSLLMYRCRRDAADFGFDSVFINTDHIGYYEKYGFRYIGDYLHQSGCNARVYKTDSLSNPETMAEFFNKRADEYDRHMLQDLQLDEFYQAISDSISSPVKRLLDLGCGTGIELERLYERFPDMETTGIDLSQEMLNICKEKFLDKSMELICGSYLELEFEGPFDVILSTYSFHHFSKATKAQLYSKLMGLLQEDGVLLIGDYTASDEATESAMQQESIGYSQEYDLSQNNHYHIDIPFTAATETELLKAAGFSRISILKEWENTTIIAAYL